MPRRRNATHATKAQKERRKRQNDLRRRSDKLADRAEQDGVTVEGTEDPLLGTGPRTTRRERVEKLHEKSQDRLAKTIKSFEEEMDELEDAIEDLLEDSAGPNVYEVDLHIVPAEPGVRVTGQVRRRNPTEAYGIEADGKIGRQDVRVFGAVGRHAKTGRVVAGMTVQPIYRTPTGYSANGEPQQLAFKPPRGGDWGSESMEQIAWSMRDHLISQMGFQGAVSAPRQIGRRSNGRRVANLKRSLT